MISIIDNKYITQWEDGDGLYSYEDMLVPVDTVRLINGYFYRAYMSNHLRRWIRPNYGFKGRYVTYWSKLNEREIKKACYLGS